MCRLQLQSCPALLWQQCVPHGLCRRQPSPGTQFTIFHFKRKQAGNGPIRCPTQVSKMQMPGYFKGQLLKLILQCRKLLGGKRIRHENLFFPNWKQQRTHYLVIYIFSNLFVSGEKSHGAGNGTLILQNVFITSRKHLGK